MDRSEQLMVRVRRAAILAGAGAASIGVAALAGHATERPELSTWLLGRGSLAAGAAVGLVLVGLGICLVAPQWRRSWVRRSGLLPGIVATALGLVALFEEAFDADLVFDRPFEALQVLAEGRVPALTAGAFTLGATALVLLALGGRRRLLTAQGLALASLGTACVGLTAQLYGFDALRVGASPFSTVSLPGLVGMLAASLGLLLARPEVGALRLVVDPTAGGASIRRLLPVTAALVLTLGALRVWGEGRGFYAGALGSAIFAVSSVFLIGALILWNALRLRDAELSLLREQEIRNERQRQFRHAIVEAPIPIVMFADDGEVLQVSRMVEEITGHPMEDLPDLTAWSRLVAGGGRGEGRSLLTSLDDFREIEVRTAGGGRRIWRIRTSSLGLLPDDRNTFVTMGLDLTDIRRADEQKDEFLAVLGHELRNPLAALSSGLELQRHHDDLERRAGIHEMMGRQVRHLSRLLDDLLDVSRISRGKITLQPELVSLNQAVERVVEEHRGGPGAGEGPRITLVMPPREIPVFADPTRLHQILGNLLGNAVKYTPEDGRIWVAVERDEEGVAVRVRDSGLGMEQHEIDTVFEPFRQLGSSDGRQRGGLGLGLTLVRQLAGLHGGSVTGASRGRGHGSTFVLRLPVSEEELPAGRSAAAPAPEHISVPEGEGVPLRVLVVDDQREVADGFAELLSLSGYEVEAAYDGESALALHERSRPDVVFLDLDLPDMDGRTLARRIRERRQRQPLLVAVSGFGGERHFERSREAGIDRHLVKPVSMPQVMDLLRGAADPASASRDSAHVRA
jgi:PAS domain S-box-containing protein